MQKNKNPQVTAYTEIMPDGRNEHTYSGCGGKEIWMITTFLEVHHNVEQRDL